MRFDDSPELFGVGIGHGTSGDIECGICKAKYNQGADEKEDYHDRETVNHTDFAGMTVCDCCFEKVEREVLRRMPDILLWYKKILDARLRNAVNGQVDLQGILETEKKLSNPEKP